jgi:hypothetical protein
MLRRATIFLILICMFAASYSRFFVVAGFELNRDYIAGKLCENRSKPWMHCDGRCYFVKKIKQAEENEKKQAENEKLNRQEISFFQEPFQLSFVVPVVTAHQLNSFSNYTFHYSNRYMDAIFRPPKNIV